jgi:hypothetical protein
MIARWPSELPRPLRAGYQRTSGESRLRTTNDKGPARQRRRFSSVTDTLDLTFILTMNEWARLLRFYREETLDGALPFIMPDFDRQGLSLSTATGSSLTTSTGHRLVIGATWLCQFSDALPVATVIGVQRQVSFRVDILP